MPAGLLSLKRSGNTSKLQKKLDTLFYMWYDYIDFGLEGSEKNFKRAVTKAGTLQETRKREFYEKPSVKRKRKSEAARKRKKF